MNMKETLRIDPKGLDRHGGMSIVENDKIRPTPNFGKRPLGSYSMRDAEMPRLMRCEVRIKKMEEN